MTFTEGEHCPSCGKESASLQGRLVNGRTIRELLCIACRYVWPAPERLSPVADA
jgi:RNA polymerase subunit RPABC4/transcription elongation factor Spt4